MSLATAEAIRDRIQTLAAAGHRSSAQIKAILQALKVPGYASIAWR